MHYSSFAENLAGITKCNLVGIVLKWPNYQRFSPLSQEPRLSCHSELSVSSGEEGGRGGGGGESPYSNGEIITNGEEADMEVDGEEGEEEEKERMVEEEEEVIDVERNPVAIEKILAFGRDLQALHTHISSGHSNDDHLKTLLQVKDIPYLLHGE